MGAVSREQKLWIALAILAVLGLFPLWMPYAIRMWATGHYQYFPLIFLTVGVLLWNRQEEIASARTAPNGLLGAGLIISISIVMAIGILLYSSFIGIVATVASFWTALYLVYGSGGVYAAAPVAALLVFTVPLPMLWDQELIVRMQLIASDLSSRFLDGLGVVHFRQGVILQTAETQFLTEEACSGIRSLFSAWATVALFSVIHRHRWWRLGINLVQTVPWVMLGNVLRIVAVVAFSQPLPWIVEGWGHELLGFVVFAFILTMVGCTDLALSHLIGRELVVETVQEPPLLDPSDHSFAKLPEFPLHGGLRTAVFASLIILAVLGIRVQWVRLAAAAPWRTAAGDAFAPPTEELLPPQLAEMKRETFKHKVRSPNAIWARNSFVWNYRRPGLNAIVSWDMPWNEWHNLNGCYRNLGWRNTATYAIPSLTDPAPGFHHSELQMQDRGRFGFVIFSAIDRHGQHVPEVQFKQAASALGNPSAFFRHALAAIGFGGRPVNVVTPDRLPASTIQVYAESTAPLTEHQLDQLRKLFIEARSTLRSSLVQRE